MICRLSYYFAQLHGLGVSTECVTVTRSEQSPVLYPLFTGHMAGVDSYSSILFYLCSVMLYCDCHIPPGLIPLAFIICYYAAKTSYVHSESFSSALQLGYAVLDHSSSSGLSERK